MKPHKGNVLSILLLWLLIASNSAVVEGFAVPALQQGATATVRNKLSPSIRRLSAQNAEDDGVSRDMELMSNGDIDRSKAKEEAADEEAKAAAAATLQEFRDDLDELKRLRPASPAADISAERTIISAGSSYTRLWTHSTWRQHSKPPHIRYMRHVIKWHASTTARKIMPAVLIAAAWAGIVSFMFHTASCQSWIVNASHMARWTGASSAVPALQAPMALLLTLRANASLTRLLEARLAWGRLVLFSRSLSSLLQVYLLPKHPKITLLAARYLAILGWILKARLRDESVESQREIVDTILPKAEADWLMAQPNRPVAIISRLRKLTATALLSDAVGSWGAGHMNSPLCFVEDRLEELEQVVGMNERIFSSPIPPTYSRHLSRIISLNFISLPLALTALGLSTSGVIVATVISAYVFMGIDEVGMEVERPFTLLPLQQLCSVVQADVTNHIIGGSAGTGLPGEMPPIKF